MARKLPAYNMKGWAVTTDVMIALTRGYIGEIPILPNRITNAVRVAMGKPPIRPIVFYYYGKPDDNLKQIFGIKQ